MFNRTKCTTHVFDCIGNFTVPQELQPRVYLHEPCAGARAPDHPLFRTLGGLFGFVSVKYGFREPLVPALAKIDVGGWEYSVIRDIIANVRNDS